MENEIRNISVRKVTLYPVGDKEEIDRAYKYIRNGMEVQSIMMNQCISAMYVAKLNKCSKEEWKELKHNYSHIPSSKLGSAYDFDMEKYPTGLPLAGGIPRVCEQKLKKSLKDGLMYGRVALPTFKATSPMMVHNDYCTIAGSKKKRTTGFYGEYDTMADLKDALMNDDNCDIRLRFTNGLVFKVVFGNKHRSAELRSVFAKAFDGEYKFCDSTIGFDKRTGKKIILNLSVSMPRKERKLDESVCVGVDLGMAIPAVCALNNDMYKRESIGSYDDFIRERTKIQAERRRVTSHLKMTSGGHGRKKKLAHLDKITLHEREFAKTYNHNISKRVITFALQNNAGYINMEKLTGIARSETKEFVLRNWSYYELQTMIEYKAEREGIKVRYIDPAYTSQTCSVCGERGDRSTQAQFKCLNPKCKSHTMYEKGFNADFNAARNISMKE